MARRRAGAIALDLAAPQLIRTLARTWKVARVGVEHFDACVAGGAFVAPMWHGDMLAPAPLHRDRGIAVLVSPSDDGGLVVRVLSRFGYRIVRGSTSRRAPRAMREMQEALVAGTPVVITPDGPRGPRHTMNVGVTWLARETGVPILPVTVCVDRAWRLRSWDAFAIPKPFSAVEIRYHRPVHVPADADDLELERIAGRVRDRMLDGTA